MGLLLDTHYVYALAGAPGRLLESERRFLASPGSPLHISAVSVWEIRLKWHALHASGAPKGPMSPHDVLRALETLPVTFVPLSPAHAATQLEIPLHYTDPFDELLLVQAQIEKMRLVTRDQKLITHPLATPATL